MTVNTVPGKNRYTGKLLALLSEILDRSINIFGESKVVALDRVWNQDLVSKVKSCGVSDTFIRWLPDFLCNHSILIVIDGINSNLYPVNSGVLQGSVIAPTLDKWTDGRTD